MALTSLFWNSSSLCSVKTQIYNIFVIVVICILSTLPCCFMDNLLQAASMALLQYPVINASIDVQVLSQFEGLIQGRIQGGGGGQSGRFRYQHIWNRFSILLYEKNVNIFFLQIIERENIMCESLSAYRIPIHDKHVNSKSYIITWILVLYPFICALYCKLSG